MKKVEMTKGELLDFFAALNVAETLGGKSENIVKFLYAVSKNKNSLKAEVEGIRKASEYLPSYIKYEEERIKIAEEYANKDKGGRPKKIVKNGRQVYDLYDEEGNHKQEWLDAFDKLNENSKAVFEERTDQLNKYEELKKEEIEVDIYQVPLDYVPQDIGEKGINGAKSGLFNLLLPMIQEEE